MPSTNLISLAEANILIRTLMDVFSSNLNVLFTCARPYNNTEYGVYNISVLLYYTRILCVIDKCLLQPAGV